MGKLLPFVVTINASIPLSLSPELLQQYNETCSGHVALRDELLDIAIRSGRITTSETDEGTAFHFNSLRAGVRKNNDDLDPFAIDIDIHASTKGVKESPGYVEQYGPHTPDFPLFIGHISVAFGEIIKLSTEPEYNQGAQAIGFPFEGFGLKLTHHVQLNLPSYNRVMLAAADQTVEEQVKDARETLLPELKYGVENCRADYDEFLTRVKYGHAVETGDEIANRALATFRQNPSTQSLINASLKACLRTDNGAENVSQLFEDYARLDSPALSSPLRRIDYSDDLHLLALSKSRFANQLLEEAVRFDRIYRNALSPQRDRVEEIARIYIAEYIERVKQVAAIISETKLSLGPVKVSGG